MGRLNSIISELSGALKRDYYSNRVRAESSLVYFTYRCTSRCRTCNIWKRNAEKAADTEPGLEQWGNILANLRDYGIKTMEIFGGDALLRQDLIYEVIRFCSRNGIETYFPTNSILLDGSVAKNLVESGLDIIYFSLDDVGQQNDLIRGKDGTLERIRNAIENVNNERKNGKPRIIVITTVSNMNYSHLPQLVKYLNDLPVDAIYLRVMEEYSPENIEGSVINGVKPEPYFTSSDSGSHLLSDGETRELRRIIQTLKADRENRVYINYRPIDEASDEAFTKGVHTEKRCLVCTSLVTVDPHGNVSPCPMYNKYVLGNLLEDDLKNIWGNKKHRDFIRKQRKNGILLCRNCSLRTYYPSFLESLSGYLRKTREKIIRKIS